MTSPPEPLVRVDDLRTHFPIRRGLLRRQVGAVRAVDGVSFSIPRGRTLGLVGESGCGKTTVGRSILRLVEPTDGRIVIGGHDVRGLGGAALRALRRRMQIVFQDPSAALNPRQTILASVCEPLEIQGGLSRDEREARAIEALSRVGIAREYVRRYPHMLSGGQKQRVNIARVLTLRPRLIVCDEVVAALDVSIRGDVLNLFAELQRDFGLTYVFITHDLSVVAHVSDRVAVTYLGRFVELGPTEAVSDRPMHPYTEALMSAEPIALPSAMRTGKRIVLEGEIPSPIDPPSGCRFRTRCPHARELCEQKEPEWRELREGHWVACHFATPDGPPLASTH